MLCSRDDSGAGFGPPSEPALWLAGARGGLVAECTWRSEPPSAPRETAFARAASLRAAAITGAALHADYGAACCATLLVDPDGNDVEAVCLR